MSILGPVMNWFGYGVAVWIFCIGVFGLVISRNWVHLAICLSVMQSSTYVLLLEIGYRTGGAAPVFADIPVGTRAVDPVVQALMLTDVVVEATVLALIVALAVQIHRRTGTLDPDQLPELKG